MAKKENKKYKYSVLTYNFNNYEIIHEPEYVDPDAEYIYVTDDKNIKSDVWKVIVDESLNTMGKWEKMYFVRYNPFLYCTTDICVRIDASMSPGACMPDVVNKFIDGGYEVGFVIGGYCDNIEDNLNLCKLWKGFSDNEIASYIDYFKKNGYNPKQKGHIGGGFQIHRKCHTTSTINSMTFSALECIGYENNLSDCARNDEIVYGFTIQNYFCSVKFMAMDASVYNGDVLTIYNHGTNNKIKPGWCRTMAEPYLFGERCKTFRFGFDSHDNTKFINGDCLYVVYYHNEHDNAEKWCKRLKSEGVDYVLMDSGSNNAIEGVNSIVTENIYYGGLWHNTRDLCMTWEKKWVFIVDDDILVDDENFRLLMDRMSNIMGRETNIGVYQPSSTEDSRNLYKRNICQNCGGLRPVPAMEGWMMLFRTDIYEEMDKLGINYRVDLSMGWGLDILTLYCSYLKGYSNALDDCVVVKHPMGPGKYDENKANQQMQGMFKFLGLDYFKMEAVVGGRVEPHQIIVK